MMSTKQIEARKYFRNFSVVIQETRFNFCFIRRAEGEQALERWSRQGHATGTICEATPKAFQQLASA
jgi:hypothetical protein